MLDLLLTLLETEGARIGPEAVSAGGADELSDLRRLGLLRDAEEATSVACDACGARHEESVMWLASGSSGDSHAVIWCPEVGRVEVSNDRLRRWAIDESAFAARLADALGTSGRRLCDVEGRVWLLGRMTLDGAVTEIYFARGLAWDDAGDVIRRAERLAEPGPKLVLVPKLRPRSGTLPEGVSVRSLDGLLIFTAAGLQLPHEAIGASRSRRRIGKPTAVRSLPIPEGVTWPDVRLSIHEDRVTISVHARRWSLSPEEAGFVDRRTAGVRQTDSWKHLKAFAHASGVISMGDLRARSATELTKHQIQALKRKLTLLLPIEGDPIEFDKKLAEYRTTFRISTSVEPTIEAPTVERWDELTIRVTPVGLVFEASRYQEASASTVVSLRRLGLTDRDEVPNRLGKLFLRCLNGDGTFTGREDDSAILKFGDRLRREFGLETSPFDFEPPNTWKARFNVAGRRSR